MLFYCSYSNIFIYTCFTRYTFPNSLVSIYPILLLYICIVYILYLPISEIALQKISSAKRKNKQNYDDKIPCTATGMECDRASPVKISPPFKYKLYFTLAYILHTDYHEIVLNLIFGLIIVLIDCHPNHRQQGR